VFSNSLRGSLPVVLVASLAFAGVLAACNELPHRRGEAVETSTNAKLDQQKPVDVVVAPVENVTGRKDLPLAAMREAFEKGLVRRRYSPLATEYVDRRVVDAAYTPGSLQEEAVLQVTIETWDATLLETRGALIVKARARLLDARNPTNGQLWTGAIDHRFDLEADREHYSTKAAMLQHACEKIAEEILAALPARSAGPAN
jgi:hypothetical protein